MLNFDELFGKLSEDPRLVSSIALAYIGDAVYEVYIRAKLISEGQRLSKNLQPKAVNFVSATAQKTCYETILPLLTEEENRVARSAKNKKISKIPKHATHEEYAKATAFEAVIGYLYLKGEKERLIFLLRTAIGEENDWRKKWYYCW